MEKGRPGHAAALLRSVRNRSCRPVVQGELLAAAICISADDLDACKTLLGAMPSGTRIGFFLVDNTGSLYNITIVYLLATSALVTVRGATDGSPIGRDRLYVVPTGSYISVSGGVSRPTEPGARRGPRLSFEFLLFSLVQEFGPRTVCVTLSGIGADGGHGTRIVVESGGLIIVLDPTDARPDRTSRHAIRTGGADLMLPLANTPDALLEYAARAAVRAEPGSLLIGVGNAANTCYRSAGTPPLPSQAALADLCQMLVFDACALAAVLTNRSHECLYFLGRRIVICVRWGRISATNCLLWRLRTSASVFARHSGGQDNNDGWLPPPVSSLVRVVKPFLLASCGDK